MQLFSEYFLSIVGLSFSCTTQRYGGPTVLVQRQQSCFDAKTDFPLHRTFYSYVSLIPNIKVPFDLLF